MTATPAANATWRLGAAAVVLMFAFDPLGNLAGAAALAVVVIAALQVYLAKHTDERVNVALVGLTAVIVVIAFLEILHPNVPSLTVGLLGFRKSATFVLGIAIGLGWRGSRTRGLRLTWWCMFVAAAASLAVHVLLPSVEQAISRDADKYTSYIRGVERMQGLLAGPFHVSMLGVFLVLSALAPGIVIRSRWVRVAAVAVGVSCVYFAQVRTGVVALAIGVVVMLLATWSAQRWAHRLLLLPGLCILGVAYIGPLTEYARQFTALRLLLDSGADDSRFTRRFTTWSEAVELIERSPVTGWGSGSAGDTLGEYFVNGERVTSHNAFLKYAVEGGIFQGLLFAALCIGIAWAVRPRRDPTRFGVAAGMTFLVFALVGAATEALPVAFGLAVILGLCARSPSATAEPEAGEPEVHRGQRRRATKDPPTPADHRGPSQARIPAPSGVEA